MSMNLLSPQSSGTGALVVAAMLDFLTFALCVPYSETTDGKQFDQLLEMVANRGRVLFKLFEVTWLCTCTCGLWPFKCFV